MVPLRRNRDFVLLETGRFLSTAGTQSTTIAYPLLVLAVTHSPAKAGIVTFARLLPFGLFGLLAGVAADRWNRRRLMIATDGVRALAIASLVAAILAHRLSFWQIPVVAFVEGAGSALFQPAAAGALRAVVPAEQLSDAAGAQQARAAVVRLAGPPVGGALFAIARAVPFLVDAVSYLFSSVSLLAMRTPFQEPREVDTAGLRARVAEGFRFMRGQPFIRMSAALIGVGNFVILAVFLVIVVAGKRQGLSGGEIGGLFAVFGAFTLVGALVSPLFRRAFSLRTIMLIELWLSIGTVAFLIRPSVYVLVAAMLPQAIAMPVTDSAVNGYRIAITPDRLLGRVESVRTSIALLVSPVGPLLAGVLLSTVSLRATVAVFAACSVGAAVWGTVSPALRSAPR